jgi:DNA-binding response OmpR family regulator
MKDRQLLLVEDDETLSDLVREMLDLFGIKVFIAHTLDEAVTAYRENVDHIPLVIFDMNLENETGLEVYEALRNVGGDFIAFLASGMFLEQEVMEYKKHGFSEIIKKPYSFMELRTTIEKYLN